MEHGVSSGSGGDLTELRLLARRAGVELSDEDLMTLRPGHMAHVEALVGLRSALAPEEEPGVTFSQQVGRDRR